MRQTLQESNAGLDSYLGEQKGDMDAASGFCLSLFVQNAFNEISFARNDLRPHGLNVLKQGQAAYNV